MLVGEDEASGLGVAVPCLRAILLLSATAITDACLTVNGAISFVGLVVPHALRAPLNPGHQTLLPLSAPGGAALLIGTNTFAQLALQPQELSVGVITAFFGAVLPQPSRGALPPQRPRRCQTGRPPARRCERARAKR